MVDASVLLILIETLPTLSAAPAVCINLASTGTVSGYCRRRSANINIERPPRHSVG